MKKEALTKTQSGLTKNTSNKKRGTPKSQRSLTKKTSDEKEAPKKCKVAEQKRPASLTK
jgi:hypothetical protein